MLGRGFQRYLKHYGGSFMLLFVLFCILPPNPAAAQNKKSSAAIRIQPKPLSLSEKIEKAQPGHTLIDTFESTLFSTPPENVEESPTLSWLHDPDIQKNRPQIIGSEPTAVEVWWKINFDGFYLGSQVNNEVVARARIRGKFLTQFTESLYGMAEIQMLTVSGSVQQIFQNPVDINGVSHREIMLLWTARDWVNFKLGAINQEFLESPLLLADIPFISAVEDFKILNEEDSNHYVSISFQQAIPSTFSDSYSTNIYNVSKTPFMSTLSAFWDYDSKSYYNTRVRGTFFYFNTLPSSIAAISRIYGNRITGEPAEFMYQYRGFYAALEQSFQIFPNLGVKLQAHYINNFTAEKNYDQGLLYSLHVPFDITENSRLTAILEYFVNQSDSSVSYYSSERYGHNNRAGFNGELIWDIYKRNVQIGLRYHNSNAIVSESLKQNETYFLLFMRTNYAKI